MVDNNQQYIGGSEINTTEAESTTATVDKQKFITRVFHENDNQVIGCEVVIYDNNSEVIDTICITDQTTLKKYIDNWDNISQYYVLRGDVELPEELQALVDAGQPTLQSVLENPREVTTINATTLQGSQAGDFALVDHSHGSAYCSTKHDSSNKDYGISTKDLYGHCKIADRLTDSTYTEATALSSHQGYVLNQSIKKLQSRNAWSSVKTKGYIKYRVNSDLRLVVCNYNRADYTGMKNSTGKIELHPAGTIPTNYAPSARVVTPMYRGDVTLYYGTDGSVNLYNLTKIKSMNLYAQVMWHY